MALHDDTAWLHPAPMRGRDNLAALSGAALNAIGAVGLTTPRAVGERHLLRCAVHLIHGPVRHLVVHDAAVLGAETLSELHQTALITQTQLWLVMDFNDSARLGGRTDADRSDLADWVAGTCATHDAEQVLALWGERDKGTGCCPPPLSWWVEDLDLGCPLPPPCARHTRIECLLAWVRRGLSSGRTTPTLTRKRLNEYANHPDMTVEDMWERTAASRDFYTHGMTALGLLHPDAQGVDMRDVAPDGSTVTVNGDRLIVPATLRTPIARLRTSRRLAGCLDHEPVAGLFDRTPGPNGRRRR
ncbi:hypothetical protein [Nocardioides sp.]|uniref:hypothetical protein n=1 Tax=Nocardioides sp. TaxID=35761 RepID=UPI0027366154|nr:hypothetical protein [Nocardioides sp.]MDP3890485.1 hypothetical protein [Nocardioides sp.]